MLSAAIAVGAEHEGADSSQWRKTFDAQLTKETVSEVTAFVLKRVSWFEYRTGRRDPGLVDELIQDALADTLAGVIAWDPTRCSLAMHLRSTIRSRLSHDIERFETFQHVDIGATNEQDLSESIAANATTSSGANLDRYAKEIEKQLRASAADDRGVLALIDLYREGITERREVCRLTRLTASAYHNAHRRLKRHIENLPESLRAHAISEMKCDGPTRSR